mmetsp:Transcript_12767/g.40034  ORF Transcript_12767/g.40034 Transcript_12767/m.40034 type:complete len:342 (+) Transcript_12767:11-1036(+)
MRAFRAWLTSPHDKANPRAMGGPGVNSLHGNCACAVFLGLRGMAKRRCPCSLRRAWLRAVRLLLPTLPEWLFELYMGVRVGKTPPSVPQVVFVSQTGSMPVTLRLQDLPVRPADMVRLVIISDTHERHRTVAVPAGDVLLHCGDILMSSSLTTQRRGIRVLEDFNSWLQTLPCKEKVVIGGNHDAALEKLGDMAAQDLLSGAVLLQDSSVTLPLASLKVYGHAYSEGHSHNRAWQTDAPNVSDACIGADVVLTHHCNRHIRAEVLARARPRVWASGHVHASHGVQSRNGTLFISAPVQSDQYRPVQPPVVVDLPRGSSRPPLAPSSLLQCPGLSPSAVTGT